MDKLVEDVKQLERYRRKFRTYSVLCRIKPLRYFLADRRTHYNILYSEKVCEIASAYLHKGYDQTLLQL